MTIHDVIHRMRYRFSEPYRIRVGRGLNSIRNIRELNALLAFCREELADEECMALNPERKKLYKATLALADETVKLPFEFALTEDDRVQPYISVYDLIEDYSGWYWS